MRVYILSFAILAALVPPWGAATCLLIPARGPSLLAAGVGGAAIGWAAGVAARKLDEWRP